ncbi:hypothetical protein BDZ45DRAFT_810230 [Acephala macrosclerotiorum]|nr:hypothetical protein BDZ45DRAFT_810230 [Acephala macrosclerotiorum]
MRTWIGDGCSYNITRGVGGNRRAVDSWTLFTMNKDLICCLVGEIGTNATAGENYGHCLAARQSVSSASMAMLIDSAGATAPATLPAGYSTTSGPATTSAASSASAKSASITKASMTGSGSRSSIVSSARSTSTKSSSGTSVATEATATVTVKSGAGVVEIGLVFLVVVLSGVMVV